jgi:aspartyl-tRNA(Asn)/glutamyl-tRNA(Gln) amidotransferase subunit B
MMAKEKDSAKIGLEIHGYLITQEKLFCKCPTNYRDEKPNTNICPICTGQPGSKPMLPNSEALKKVIAISLMLGCKINTDVVWQRKHYDWPDLPKGYQDTTSGAYSIPVGENGEYLGIRIHHCHIEEDPARWDPETGTIDYNRCGMPLIEIVTEPDFKSSKEVREWLNQLLITLSYIKAVNADAGIKADVNVSVNVNGKQGERVEVKNINSVYSIERAIDFEISRQTALIKSNEKIKKETRTFIESKKETVSMRSKEAEDDYRFIPDPDLPVIEIKNELTAEIKKKLPELPHLKVERFIKKHKLDERAAKVLSQNKELADFYEKIAEKINPDLASAWVTVELLRVLNWNKKELHEVSIKPEHFIELLELIEEKELTELKAKEMLNKFVPKSFSPKEKMMSSGRIDSKEELEKICKKIIDNNTKAVSDYKSGQEKALFFLMGEVMKETHKRADSELTRKILLELLKH